MKARNVIVLIVILGLVGIVIFAKSQSRKTANPTTGPVVVEQGKPAWLFVHSNMCVSCKEMSKVFIKLKSDRALAEKVQFLDVIFDDLANAELIRKYEVTMIPTSIILDSRGQAVARKIGPISEDELRKLLKDVE